MIELPEFMTANIVERTYGRVKALRNLGRSHLRAQRYLTQGRNRVRARDPKLLLFLERGADVLQAKNDAQKDRFEEQGFRRQDFAEYAQWREAYIKASEPRRDDVQLEVYAWIYAAVAEALEQ